jgi:hypothetical protein
MADAIAGSGSETVGWNQVVRAVIKTAGTANFSRSTDERTLTITLPAAATFDDNQWENLSLTVPKELMTWSGGQKGDLTATSTLRVDDAVAVNNFVQTSLELKSAWADTENSATFLDDVKGNLATALRVRSSRVVMLKKEKSSETALRTKVTFQLWASTVVRADALLTDLTTQVNDSVNGKIYSLAYTKFVEGTIAPKKETGIAGQWSNSNSASTTSSNVRQAALTLKLVVTGDTFITFDAATFLSKLVDTTNLTGLKGSDTTATGFNQAVLPNITSSMLSLSSDKLTLSVSIPRTPAYSVTANDTITLNVHKDLLHNTSTVEASTVTITKNATATLTTSKTTMTAETIAAGGATITVALDGAAFVSAITTDIRDAIAAGVKSSLDASKQETAGWDATVIAALKAAPVGFYVLNAAKTTLTINLPAVANFATNFNESIKVELPVSAMALYVEAVTATTTFPVTATVVDAASAVKVESSLKLQRNIEQVTGANEAAFKTEFETAVAKSIGVPTNRISLKSVSSGSIVVVFTATGSSHSSANALLQAIQTQAASSTSALSNEFRDIDTGFAVSVCPASCGNGSCSVGKCVCNAGWIGETCTVKQTGGAGALSASILPILVAIILVLIV